MDQSLRLSLWFINVRLGRILAQYDMSTLFFGNLKKGDTALQEKKKSVETEAIDKDKTKKAAGDKEAGQVKKKSSETAAVDMDRELSVSLLNIQVGLIRKAWKHPSADRYAYKFYC